MGPPSSLVKKVKNSAPFGTELPVNVFVSLIEQAFDDGDREAARILCNMTKPVGKISLANKISPDVLQRLFQQCVEKKDWEAAKILCDITKNRNDTGSFDINYVLKLASKSGNMQDIYELHRAFRDEIYQPTSGPLPKSKYTTQLEQLTRELMQPNGDKVYIKGGSDELYLVLPSGNQYNWSKIRKFANLQHIILEENDFSNYTNYVNSVSHASAWKPRLDQTKASEYQTRLYNSSVIPKDPKDRIRYQEMQAINIYTGSTYADINGILRDAKPNASLRDALITCVMAASGVRRLPATLITDTYRKTALFNLDEQRQAAAKRAVISISGFVSTSTQPGQFQVNSIGDTMLFHYTNVTGIFVAPISQCAHESEFLMLPGQFRYAGYEYDAAKHEHYFEVKPATDITSHLTEDLASTTNEACEKTGSSWLSNTFRTIQNLGANLCAEDDNTAEEDIPNPLPPIVTLPKPLSLIQAMTALNKKVTELQQKRRGRAVGGHCERTQNLSQAEIAFDLESELNRLIVLYFEQREIDLDTFKTRCHNAIDEAKPLLTTRPDDQWTTLLNRLQLIIQQLIHKVSFGYFFKNSNKAPSTNQIIEEIEVQVDSCNNTVN